LYIHRLGRTGRAGKSGKGLLVLLPFETTSLGTMSKRRISKDDEFTRIVESSPETEKLMEPVQKLIRSGHAVLSPSAESAYKAFLAYYTATDRGTKGAELMECGAMIARSVGLVKLPEISEQLEDKLS
jgi:ATP-dependent RNA helicase MSS116